MDNIIQSATKRLHSDLARESNFNAFYWFTFTGAYPVKVDTSAGQIVFRKGDVFGTNSGGGPTAKAAIIAKSLGMSKRLSMNVNGQNTLFNSCAEIKGSKLNSLRDEMEG